MVWRLGVVPVLALLLAMPLFVDQATAQRRDDRGPRGDWELLGSTRVNGLRIDRDTISIGKREGRFKSVAFAARDSAVFLYRVDVVYGNDKVDTFTIRKALEPGERTPPLDLRGDDRLIKRITIEARGGRNFRKRAFIDVFGEQDRPRERWELLGKQEVGFRRDRDVIKVGRREGRFDKIALEVNGNDVEILDLKVFFHRGPPQDVKVRQFIKAGGRTRPIDLKGDDRIIDRIELVYRSRPGNGGGRATVGVYGLQSNDRRGPPPPPPPPPRAHWEELGCQKVGFGADRDVIHVGRREGRFSAIRLRVERSDVLILSLKVVYERGPVDDFDVKTHIRAGGETRPLDLRGERRAIKQVELLYTSIPSFKGSSRVCVDGRK